MSHLPPLIHLSTFSPQTKQSVPAHTYIRGLVRQCFKTWLIMTQCRLENMDIYQLDYCINTCLHEKCFLMQLHGSPQLMQNAALWVRTSCVRKHPMSALAAQGLQRSVYGLPMLTCFHEPVLFSLVRTYLSCAVAAKLGCGLNRLKTSTAVVFKLNAWHTTGDPGLLTLKCADLSFPG